MTNPIKVLIAREPGTEDLPLPGYQTDGASGLDLFCACPDSITIEPGQTVLVSTGISVSLPPGYEGQVRSRSGLALKHGLAVLNSPGTIDRDYRGVVSVILTNLGKTPYTVKRGMRIAQLVIAPVAKAELEVVPSLDETARSIQGFGHTGYGIHP